MLHLLQFLSDLQVTNYYTKLPWNEMIYRSMTLNQDDNFNIFLQSIVNFKVDANRKFN